MKLNEVIAKYGNADVDESKIKEVLGVKESKVWRPEMNEEYWFASHSGMVYRDTFENYFSDNGVFQIGNCFKTETEAEFARDKQIFLTKFEHYLRENEDEPVDWSNAVPKHFIKYDYDEREIIFDLWRSIRNQGTFYTTSLEALQAFIKNNESDIKKYMFGVK